MDINAIVAHNLRTLRESGGFSLEQASKLTGVSKSMLGQIERNEVTPTIAVLWKIAKGFKVSFTTLTSERDRKASIIRKSELTPLAGDEGRYLNYPVFPFSERRPFEIYRITVKPGGKLDAAPHLAESEEYISVYAGCVAIIAGADEYRLSEGDSICFKSDVPHSYANCGETDVEMCMIIYYREAY